MTVIEAIKKALKEQGVSESHAERVQKAFGVNAVDGVAAAVKAFKGVHAPSIEEADKTAKEKAEEARKAAIAEYEKGARPERRQTHRTGSHAAYPAEAARRHHPNRS